ncbi:hypothetical protein Tco_0490463 [Tanacetum coccineum]
MDTQCASNSLDPLSHKLDDENMSLEFQTRAQTKLTTYSLQEKLNDTIYENATLRAQLHTMFSEQQSEVKGTSANTMFAKPSILGKPPSTLGTKLYYVTPFPKTRFIPKVVEKHDLSKPVTSHSFKTRASGMTSGHISSRLALIYALSTITSQKPIERELDLLFEAMYDDYIGGKPSDATRTVPAAPTTQNLKTSHASTTNAEFAPTPTNSSSQASNTPSTSYDVDKLQSQPQHV